VTSGEITGGKEVRMKRSERAAAVWRMEGRKGERKG
jgi:hypothetical protein